MLHHSTTVVVYLSYNQITGETLYIIILIHADAPVAFYI